MSCNDIECRCGERKNNALESQITMLKADNEKLHKFLFEARRCPGCRVGEAEEHIEECFVYKIGAENARMREALETIINMYEDSKDCTCADGDEPCAYRCPDPQYVEIAKSALSQGEGDLSGYQHNHEGCDCQESSTCDCYCHNR